jgi:hypothetical protein
MSKNELEMRRRFDFSKPTRGRFYDRYQQGHTVSLLDRDPDAHYADPLETPLNAASTREAGKRVFVSNVQAAGLGIAEPLSDEHIDFLIYSDLKRQDRGLVSWAVQLITSVHKTFSLHKTDIRIPHSLLAYVWNAKDPNNSSVYALTFEEALRIIESKRYTETDSWVSKGGYSVTNAGIELQEMLEPYRMTQERWHQKLQNV